MVYLFYSQADNWRLSNSDIASYIVVRYFDTHVKFKANKA